MPYSDQIIESIPDRKTFMELLKSNPGIILVKFGATWCGPCKKVDPLVDGFFESSPSNVLCAKLDVDESFDLYSYFKYHKITNGIPVIMRFDKDNLSGRPDDSVTGSDLGNLREFFIRCGAKSRELS
jgi:thiol-disulfide isomerase/thioredoxin